MQVAKNLHQNQLIAIQWMGTTVVHAILYSKCKIEHK